MSLPYPIILSSNCVDGCIFLTWSSVDNANHYEIEVQTNSCGQKNIYYSNTTSLLIKKLEINAFYDVRVRALNGSRSSNFSLGIKVSPKSWQPLSYIQQISNGNKGVVTIRWTSAPTDFGFQIERCDVGDDKGCKCIASIPFNEAVIHEDETNCHTSRGVCLGHYYKITYMDTKWDSGAGVLSKRIFCM